jgi:ATP-dependent Lon protease
MAVEILNTPKINNDDELIIQPGRKPKKRTPEGDVERLSVPDEVAVLPVRNVVLFPGTVVPLAIGREKSQRLLNAMLPDQKILAAVCQKRPDIEDPGPDDLYSIGTSLVVLKLLRMDEGNQSLIVHGVTRVRFEEWTQTEPFLKARVSVLHDIVEETTETEALMVNAREVARQVIELAPNIPEEAAVVLNNIDQPGPLSDFLISNMQLEVPAKQALLEELRVNERLRRVSEELQHQLEVLKLSDKIQGQVRQSIDKSQREYYLQEQLKAIQKELGQADEREVEARQLRQELEKAEMPEAVEKEAFRELSRLEKIPNVSPEYNVIRTYLELMSELPWSRSTEDKLDVNVAEKVLNADHYDLEKVKRRILEYLAVRKLAPESRGPILCFVGPPGVGKTSLGQSIARALGRKFIRMSLGGMRDEAELRGHRRTYIGAMPGRIIQEIRKAGTNNPVFMLDELDKVGADFRGDPTSALLEILDPAQNNSFQDHYLNVPFDLSKVLFIATANYMQPVPPALRDRMEVLELPGYTDNEKLHIARKYLVPRQLEQNGLSAKQARWTEEALHKIIRSYTREAGVRELERQIGSICRGIAAMIARGKSRGRKVTPALVSELLGPVKYQSELALRTSVPGVATGLAYTPTGGEIIFIESAAYPGKGNLTLTGQIGDVMKESVQAAYSLLKSRAEKLGIKTEDIAKTDIHVHVPAAAVPKDGPSAGVSMFTSLMSLLTNKPVHSDVAMTGEITLRGLVLPVGGIKEKMLAAKRAGIKTVILPKRNEKDVQEVPGEARDTLNFHFAKTVDDVLRVALGEEVARKASKDKAAGSRSSGSSRSQAGNGRSKAAAARRR